MTIKQAVALLYPPREDEIKQLETCLSTTAENSNFAIIEIINAKNTYDSLALKYLIKTISRQQEPVTLIIDAECYSSRTYTIAWCVFGTLLIAGLLDEIYVYYGYGQQDKDYRENKAEVFEKVDFNFLEASSLHFELMTSPTYRHLFLK